MAEIQKIAIAVIRDGDRFLIGKRPPGVPLSGLWEFPGGKVKEGESAQDAAQRECLEETGLTIKICGAYPSVQHEYKHGKLELQFFDCRLAHSSQAPRPPFLWVSRDSLKDYEFPAANKELIRILTSDA